MEERDGFVGGSSDDLFLQLVENSRDVLFYLNANTVEFEHISPSVEDITGFSASEIKEMGFKGLVERYHPDDHDAMEEFFGIVANKEIKGKLPT